MKEKHKLLIAIIFLFFAFLCSLYFLPVITFFIILSLSTVYTIGNFLEKHLKNAPKTLMFGIFSFSIYLIIAIFIFVLISLVQKINAIAPDQFLSHKYLNWAYSKIRAHIDFVKMSSTLAEIGGYSIIYPVLTFFLLSERIKLRKASLSLIPNKYFEMLLNILYHINKKLRGYFKGLLIETGIYILVCFLGIVWLVPKYALAFGIIGGIANVIPFLGTVFNYLFFAFVLFLLKGKLGLIVAVIVVSLAQFIDMIVYPLTYAKVLSLPSSIIIISVLIWGKLFGIVGMILAVPMSTVIYAVVVEFGRSFKYY
ncbi:MAG: AI-2E family transporter [Thermodesulfobacteria bacterium]|nr:AI-2E family transporter [Thermodesulfobacteriota bacterium]